MAEWLKAHAWKACVPQGTVGSNPTLSARIEKAIQAFVSDKRAEFRATCERLTGSYFPRLFLPEMCPGFAVGCATNPKRPIFDLSAVVRG